MCPINTVPSQLRPAAKIRRAFSLIEAAIVLGVVGLVIGGIWVAASSIQDKIIYNDVLQIYSSATQIADAHSQVLNQSASMVSLNNLILNTPLPGSFKNQGGYIGNGNMGIIFNYDRSNHLGIGFFLYQNPSTMSNPRPNPSFCASISSHLLAQPNFGTAYVTWMNASYTTLGQWDIGSAKPTFSDYAQWCKTATIITASGMN